ncbi:MAG TPA: aromatic acid exporter family protein, partial [Kineosporiaceae bacterium]|nr:aromatic acid exporter family protein [Kineosporiaceae bacterium]
MVTMTTWGHRRVQRLAGRMAARYQQRGTLALRRAVRFTVAAVAAYLAAVAAFPRADPPLLAPLTALLVVQLTPVSVLLSGIERVVSVVAGVTLAVLFSSVVGLTWWSLGLLILASLLIGQVLRLGANLLEVPISAMLVLGVGLGARSAETAAWQRISETLAGAAIGVLANLVFPSRVAAGDAGTAIEGLAVELARLLERAAGDLGGGRTEPGWLADRAADRLGEARLLTHDIPNVGTALLRAEESRRLNLRALGTPDAGPGLRQGLEALEHSAIAIRGMFGSFEVVARRWEAEDRTVDPDSRAAVALLLRELAGGLRSFGRLVRQEADPAEPPPDPAPLQACLDDLHEGRARVTDLLLVTPREDPGLAEVNTFLLHTVERLLRELDLDARISRQARRPP